MTTEEIIIHIFCKVDDQMPQIPKHSQAKLYPSELVTVGVLFALKGGYFRAFYRWLKRDYDALFGELPDRTRLLRALKTHQDWIDTLLADPTVMTVIDTYPIELIFPIREGRSQRQIGKKGRDKGQWSIGVKLCWLLNQHRRVVKWDWNTMNTHDQHFHHVIRAVGDDSVVFADEGFRKADGIPDNLNLCKKGTWNERMFVETALSMVTVICDLKRIRHRVDAYVTTRLACVSAMFNVLLDLFHDLHPDAHPLQMSIAEFSL
ncbi:MAG: transposase [Chloroflexota bacterium]